MNEIGLKAHGVSIADFGFRVASARWNLPPAQIIEEAILRSEGHLAASGALAVDTGAFTGRAPKDRFIVRDRLTERETWWSDVNIPISTETFERLYNKVPGWLGDKDEDRKTGVEGKR